MKIYLLSILCLVCLVGCETSATQDQQQMIEKDSNGNKLKRGSIDVPEYEVVQENGDGSIEIVYNRTAYREEIRTRMVTVNKTRTEERSRETKNGIETYTVEVPYVEQIPQSYTVMVPYTEQVSATVPKGKKIDSYLAEKLTELKELKGVNDFDDPP